MPTRRIAGPEGRSLRPPRVLQSEPAVRAAQTAVLMLTLSGLAACDVKGSPSDENVVLATVNKREITAARLQRSLAASDAEAGSGIPAEQALDALINEELLVQEAIASGLDRDPLVAASQALASRQILAERIVEHITAEASAVSMVNIRRYYDENPALYAERRLYEFRVFSVAAAAVTRGLQRDLDGAHTTARIRQALERHRVKYSVQSVTAGAEELPASKMRAFTDARVADLLLVEHGSELLLMWVTAIRKAPIEFSVARSSIEAKLRTEQQRAAFDDYLNKRRAEAAIHIRRDALTPYLVVPPTVIPPLATTTNNTGVLERTSAAGHTSP